MTMTKKNYENNCVILDAKANGDYVGLTSIAKNDTTKTQDFASYFKTALPNYVGMSIGDRLLNVVNEHIKTLKSDQLELVYKEIPTIDIHLVPVGENILLHVQLVTMKLNNGNLSNCTVIDGFIVNENATNDDVQLVIDLMK